MMGRVSSLLFSIIPSENGNRSTIVWTTILGGCVTFVCVYLFTKRVIHYNNKASHLREIEDRKRKSRLLQHQFGNIMEENDLVLQEEETTSANAPLHRTQPDLTSAEYRHDSKPQNSSGIHHRDRNNNGSKTSLSASTISQQSVSPTVAAEQPTTLHSPLVTISDDISCGLEAFWHWCDVEASLFRIYTIGEDDIPPPYHPSSRRGNVALSLQVTNQMPSRPIHVYWIDYNGTEVHRGTIRPGGGTWFQTTWIDHPWIFRSERQQLLLQYIPYRVIPTTKEAPTVSEEENSVGLHRFSICPDDKRVCRVDDPILPHPARHHLTTVWDAMQFAFLHCLRMDYRSWKVLKKYLQMIVQHPNEVKYRRIRIANATFRQHVWDTPARGVLLAVGFVEHQGYVEFHSRNIFNLYDTLLQIDQWEKRADSSDQPFEQPIGADGYGRAGYRR